MSQDEHIQAESYLQTRAGNQSPASLALRILDHLVATCPECQRHWEHLARDQETVRRLLREELEAEVEPQGEEPDDHLPCCSREARREDHDIERLRAIRTSARKQTWTLASLPPEERPEVIRNARSQFHSRGVAEYLLDRCRQVIHSQPSEAASFASLVPLALHWTPGADGTPWAAELVARSAAWKANVLRVQGDLPAAARAFARLRGELVDQPIESPRVLAELRSLEASLCIAQRRLAQAHELLELAELLYRSAGDRDGAVRTLLKRGNLLFTAGEPGAALFNYERAAEQLPSKRTDPEILLSVVQGRVAALCELERYADAEAAIEENLHAYEDAQNLHAGTLLRAIRARIAMGLGRYEEAEQGFRDVRQALLLTDRMYEAALASIDLAEVLLRTGRHRELETMAAQLVKLFPAQQVERETLAALRLLAQAVAARKLTLATLSDLRSRLQEVAEDSRSA